MNIKNELKNFYDNEAKKYHSSRQKLRTDWKRIVDEIIKSWKKEVDILEFWCWWWRCINYLDKNLKWIKINYTWIDLSNELLKYAKKDNPKRKFICDDISNFIKDIPQESYDFIIGIASFQHIPTQWERVFLMKHFYRTLKYWWEIVMINWSISKRFLKKYKKTIIKSYLKYIFTIWKHNRRNLLIPRTNSWHTKDRFYHIFSKKELEILTKEWWFLIDKLTYIDKNWQEINSRKKSNNTILIWLKKIFI
jgi:SAM-dependent methyltransferase